MKKHTLHSGIALSVPRLVTLSLFLGPRAPDTKTVAGLSEMGDPLSLLVAIR